MPIKNLLVLAEERFAPYIFCIYADTKKIHFNISNYYLFIFLRKSLIFAVYLFLSLFRYDFEISFEL